MLKTRRGRRALAAGLCLAGTAATAGAAQPLAVEDVPTSLTVGFERVRLPGGERMGLLGVSYLFEMAPNWWIGPAAYGAATGQRGGLFTWGGEAQGRWRLGSSDWGVVAGLSATGGGGAGAPVGGGLMLRPHLDLVRDFDGVQLGLSASQVRFPSGEIRSTQLGLVLMANDRFAFTAPHHQGERVAFGGRGGLGFDAVAPLAGAYRHAARGRMGYVGLRLERRLDEALSLTLDAAGAAQGAADGYAQTFAGVAVQRPLGRAASLGARAALGLAGGGGVNTGGGTLGQLALTGRLQLTPRHALLAEAGRVRSFKGDFDSSYAQLALGIELDPPDAAIVQPTSRTVTNGEWALALQSHRNVLRKDGTRQALETIGLKFRRDLGRNAYLTAQAHSAVAGSAGAYSIGLIGMGAMARMDGFSAGVEALVGASGGGGVANEGGAVVQPMAWIGHDLGRHARLRLGAGRIRSLKGHDGLDSTVAELSLGFEFGAP